MIIDSSNAMNVIRYFVDHQDYFNTTNMYMNELHMIAINVTSRHQKNPT